METGDLIQACGSVLMDMQVVVMMVYDLASAIISMLSFACRKDGVVGGF